MQTIDKQRLIEWVEKHNQPHYPVDYIPTSEILSFIKKETSESDELQEGDWCKVESIEFARELVLAEGISALTDLWAERYLNSGLVLFDCNTLLAESNSNIPETEPSEFLRRARNTFKNK